MFIILFIVSKFLLHCFFVFIISFGVSCCVWAPCKRGPSGSFFLFLRCVAQLLIAPFPFVLHP